MLNSWIEFWFYFRKNRGALLGLVIIFLFLILGCLAPWISPYAPDHVHEGFFRVVPAWQENGNTQFLFGTDDVGRDILSRLIYGSRVSLSIGFFVVTLSLGLGTLLGLFAGYYGGWLDQIIMRVTDMLMVIPSILLAIVIVAILGPSLTNAILAVSIVSAPNFIRLVRASVIAEKTKVYISASRSFGANNLRLIFWHILPNCLAPIIIQATLGFSEGILGAAALGFLGLGAQPPTAEWGTMLSDARSFIESSPWMVTLPGLCIFLVVIGFNLVGDGLRDALDPKLKK